MRAMRLHHPREPLRLDTIPEPRPGAGEIVVRVLACGVCRTDLHIVDGELAQHRAPLVPGHEVVGRIVEIGAGVNELRLGQRVGIPWLGHACGHCPYCRTGRENLCDTPAFTGYDRDGGYAEFAVAEGDFCVPLPDGYADAAIAPLLCAGLIGFRSYRRAGEGRTLGLFGFGAAAHIICQLAIADGRTVFAFTRPGDTEGQRFARSLGCAWAGGSDETPPEPLDAAIIFAPAGPLVPAALKMVRKAGRVVCAGIHMSDIPAFAYGDLWGEREIVSVANLTRGDARDFLARAARQTIRTSVQTYRLEQANDALSDLREGRVQGAAVLLP
ncbi:MAG TPA: zinc-dependent alcohol dehydrogenase family protein [Devosia sp.]|nr:zinc-dependent alcohol dehydrogenase family protein [Devosia sp.]